jgi:hypothetical protein
MVEKLPPPERPGTPEARERERTPLFADDLKHLDGTAGAPQPRIPEPITQEKLDRMERELTQDNRFDSFSEQFRANELLYRSNALQRQAELDDPQKRQKVNREEFAVVNEAVTYYEYFPRVVQNVSQILRAYESIRSDPRLPPLPATLRQGEGEASLYLKALEGALAERVAYANVLLIDGKLSKHGGDEGELMHLKEQYLRDPRLSESSKQALSSDLPAKWRRGNELNQRIIDILAGAGGIQGVREGFFPQSLYFDILTWRYEQLLEEEKAIVRDRSLEPTEKKKRLARLTKERTDLKDAMILTTDDLGRYQLSMAELTTIQHQFGDHFEFEGVRPSTPDQTPENIRRAVAETTKQRSEFHLNRVQAFSRVVREEILSVGALEMTEDYWNEYGRKGIQAYSRAMARFFTFPLPETFGIRQHFVEKLSGPLDAALGWPEEKDTWEELTPDEKKEVLKKTKSVADAVRGFDQTKLQLFQETVGVIRAMPPAERFIGENVQEPLPDEHVVPGNYKNLIEKYGGATVYAMLFRQLDADWGSPDGRKGLMGEYSTFYRKIEETIGTHINVAEAAFEQQRAYERLSLSLLSAALLALGAGAAGGLAGWLAKKFASRAKQQRINSELESLREEVTTLRRQGGGRSTGTDVSESPQRASALSRGLRELNVAEEVLTDLEREAPQFLRALETSRLSSAQRRAAIELYMNLLKTHPEDTVQSLLKSDEFIRAIASEGDSFFLRRLVLAKGVKGAEGLSEGLRTFGKWIRVLRAGRYTVLGLSAVGSAAEVAGGGFDLYSAYAAAQQLEQLERLGFSSNDLQMAATRDIRNWSAASGTAGVVGGTVGFLEVAGAAGLAPFVSLGVAGPIAIVATPVVMLKAGYEIREAEWKRRRLTPPEAMALSRHFEAIEGRTPERAAERQTGLGFLDALDIAHGAIRFDTTSWEEKWKLIDRQQEWSKNIIQVLLIRELGNRGIELPTKKIQARGQEIDVPHVDHVIETAEEYIRGAIFEQTKDMKAGSRLHLGAVSPEDFREIIDEAATYVEQQLWAENLRGRAETDPLRRLYAEKETFLGKKFADVVPADFRKEPFTLPQTLRMGKPGILAPRDQKDAYARQQTQEKQEQEALQEHMRQVRGRVKKTK